MRKFQVYDSLAREVREFAPLVPPRVGIFVCGLTPYAPAHVGHGRGFVVFDMVARALRRWGYRVLYVQTVTNVDDKVIARAAEEGADPLALSDRYFREYLECAEALGIRSTNYYAYATDHVPDIIAQVQALVDRGFGYVASDGSVYFSVARFPGYGRLSGQKVAALQPGARVERDERKQAPEDFVLWKAARPGEPSWESPWGPGRPGWHIEDTAITGRIFGPRYDLHGGGLDLIFPHHEAEIAQAESATGEAPLVNYWMHWGLLNMGGEKMSKSIGNVSSLEGAIETHGAAVLRFYYLNAHYRSSIEFDPQSSLREAGEAYATLARPADRLFDLLHADGPERAGADLPSARADAAEALVEQLDQTLAQDFNSREAIALLFGWSRRLAEDLGSLERLSGPALEQLASPYRWGQDVLGLFERAADGRGGVGGAVVAVLLQARQRARARGDFAEADRIRQELRAAGVVLEDDATGTRWSAVRD